MPVPNTFNFGWKKDELSEEQRRKNPQKYGFMTAVYHPNLEAIRKVDLLPFLPAVYDQGNIASCTANALITAFQCQAKKLAIRTPPLSRLFLYFEERVREGHVENDDGAMIKTGVDILRDVGVSQEDFWPYNPEKLRIKPEDKCYDDAKKRIVVHAGAVKQGLNDLKQCLLDGHCIVFGFMVYPSFLTLEVAKTGMVPTPDPNKEQPIGGHAVMIYGFDDTLAGGSFMVRNSWGSDWAIGGNCFMKYDHILSKGFADDFWAIKLVKCT